MNINQFIQGSASNATLTIGTAREGVILRAITGLLSSVGAGVDQVVLTITYRGQVLTIGSRDQVTANLAQTFTFMEGASGMSGAAPAVNYNLLGVLPPGMVFDEAIGLSVAGTGNLGITFSAVTAWWTPRRMWIP